MIRKVGEFKSKVREGTSQPCSLLARANSLWLVKFHSAVSIPKIAHKTMEFKLTLIELTLLIAEFYVIAAYELNSLD